MRNGLHIGTTVSILRVCNYICGKEICMRNGKLKRFAVTCFISIMLLPIWSYAAAPKFPDTIEVGYVRRNAIGCWCGTPFRRDGEPRVCSGWKDAGNGQHMRRYEQVYKCSERGCARTQGRYMWEYANHDRSKKISSILIDRKKGITLETWHCNTCDSDYRIKIQNRSPVNKK